MKGILFLFLLAFTFSYSSRAQEQLLPIQVEGKWGFINDSGRVLVSPLYASAQAMGSYGIVYNYAQDSCGIVFKNGQIEWFADMQFAADWQQSPYLKTKSGKLLSYNLQTREWLEADFSSITALDGEFAKVSRNGLQGVVRGLETVLPMEWEHIEQKRHCFIVAGNGKRKVFNQKGAFVMDLSPEQKIHDTWWPLLVSENEKGGIQLINPTKKNMSEQKWKGVTYLFKSKYRLQGAKEDAVFDVETGFEFPIDKNWRIEPYGAYYKIRKGNKSGVLTREGAVWIPPQYRDVRVGKDFIYLLGTQGWGLSQRDGSELLPCKFNEISQIGSDLFKVNRQGQFGLYTTAGKRFIPVKYDQLIVYSSMIKAFKGPKTTLFQLAKGPRIVDSMVFNKTINSVANRARARRSKKLISSKDTFNVNSFENCCYYSEMLGVWRRVRYTEDGMKVTGAKYLEITPLGESGFLLTKRMANKNVVRLSLDEEYTFNYRRGVMKKSNCHDEITPKYCAIDRDELEMGAKKGIVRAIGMDGNMTLLSLHGSHFQYYQCSYIGAENSRGYRRFNTGGIYTVSDTMGPYTICSQYEFKRRFGLLPTGGAFNVEQLKQRYVNIEGGKWGLINEKGESLRNYNVKKRSEDQTRYFDYSKRPIMNHFLVSQGDSIGRIQLQSTQHHLSQAVINRAIEPIMCLDDIFFAYAPFDSAYGYIDSAGNYLKRPTYSQATSFSNGRAFIYTERGWAPINGSFDTIESHSFQMIRPFKNGYSQVYKAKHWGIIDSNGGYAAPLQYYKLMPYTDEQTWAFAAGGWRILNNKGLEVGTTKYKQVSPFYHGLAFATNDRKKGYALINSKGEELSKPVYFVKDNFSAEGFAKVSKKKKYYIIDKEGEFVFNKGYDRMGDYSDGWVLAKKGKSFYALHVRGERVKLQSELSYQGTFQSGLVLTLSQGKYGYTDTTGKLVIATTYKEAGEFKQGRAFVINADKVKQCITPAGEVVFSYTGDLVSHFNKGTALFKNDEGFFYLNRKGVRIGNVYFDEARPFKNGKAMVKIGERWNLMDRKGKLVSKQGFLSIRSTNGITYSVTEWNGYGLANVMGKTILHPVYDSIEKAGPNLLRVVHYDNTYYFDVGTNKWLFHPSLF